MVACSNQGCSGPVRSGPVPGFVFSGPGRALRSGFQFFRSGPVRVSKNFRSGFSPLVRVSFFSGPVLSGPGLQAICLAYN